MRGHRLHAIVAGLAAVILFAEMLWYLPSNTDHERGRTDLNGLLCVTYNSAWKWNDSLFAWIEQNQPDVVAFQEFSRNYFRYDSTRIKELGYEFHLGNLLKENSGIYGVLVRGDIVSSDSLLMSKPRFRRRKFHYIDAVIQGYSVRIVNVHLASVFDRQEVSKFYRLLPFRYYQARELAATIESWDHHRIILLGDFNSTPTDRSVQPVAKYLHDTWIDAGYGLGATWHTNQPLHRIDYIFQRGFSSVRGPGWLDCVESDHLGYYVTLIP
jgi:endonuclease/exonuclease/phosphatase (EEP) superfamily protein YafD